MPSNNTPLSERTVDGLNANVPDKIEELYINSSAISLVTFRKCIEQLINKARVDEINMMPNPLGPYKSRRLSELQAHQQDKGVSDE